MSFFQFTHISPPPPELLILPLFFEIPASQVIYCITTKIEISFEYMAVTEDTFPFHFYWAGKTDYFLSRLPSFAEYP